MKKLSLVMPLILLTSSAWAVSVSKFYFKQYENNLKFTIKGKDLKKLNEEIYIDADNNKKTGFNSNIIKGVEYLIKDENLYHYENNSWVLISQSISEKYKKKKKLISIDIRDLNLAPFIRSYLVAKNKTLKSARKNIINLQKDYYVKKFYDYWKKTYLVKENDNMYRVAFDKNDKSRTVSEGQGYGMLITALMYNYDPKAKEYFDGLYRFAKAHPSKFSSHLMAWQYPESNSGEASAFDGDADIAYALILADKIWGSKGDINYKAEAKKVLEDIWNKTIGPDSYLPMLGDWVNPNGDKYNQYTFRTSDCMLSHFKVFAKFTKNKKWLNVVNACKNALFELQNENTGLVPDFAIKENGKFIPAYKNFLGSSHAGDYDYNACRDPMRIGADALIYDDEFSTNFVNKISNWLSNTISTPSDIKAGYTLDGKVYNNYFSNAFASPFAVGLAREYQNVSDEVFDYVKDIHQNYYEDSLNLISMSILSGRYVYLSGYTTTKAPNVKLNLTQQNSSDIKKTTPSDKKTQNNTQTYPPYSIKKFKPILDHSKLQYPNSQTTVKEPGEFEGFKTDYFYAQNSNLIFVVKQKPDFSIDRLELREKYPNKKYYGEWKVNTKKTKELKAAFKFEKPELKEFTFLQIHTDPNIKNSINKPLLRIVWLDYKSKNGKKYYDYIWAIVKTDSKGEKNIYVPLMKRNNNIMHIKIKVRKNKLYITSDKKKFSKKVSFWKKYYNYFKAGIYVSGSANKKIDPLKRNAKIEFIELNY